MPTDCLWAALGKSETLITFSFDPEKRHVSHTMPSALGVFFIFGLALEKGNCGARVSFESTNYCCWSVSGKK